MKSFSSWGIEPQVNEAPKKGDSSAPKFEDVAVRLALWSEGEGVQPESFENQLIEGNK